jgi:glyoxylase-like metal-dependent hydrolase (beta-lactamase superfamily II)
MHVNAGFGRFALLATLALACGFCVATAEAAAPLMRTQAPGFYRMMVGDFEVTALSDGTQPLATDRLLVNVKPEEIRSALAASYLESPVENSDNAYLVNTGRKLVLIDAGSGKLLGPSRGQLRANLVAAGYRPEQVDEVYLTHLHPDHVGGLTDGETPMFPNAIVRAERKDADYWLSKGNMDRAPEQYKRFFAGAMASLAPYIKAGRFESFQGDTALVAGVRAVPTPGHTPGHSSFVVESKGQKIVFWGDLIHVLAVQLGRPTAGIAFDSDVNAAAMQREAALADAAKEGYIVAGAHISFPGAGRVRSAGNSYEWVPLNYTVPH